MIFPRRSSLLNDAYTHVNEARLSMPAAAQPIADALTAQADGDPEAEARALWAALRHTHEAADSYFHAAVYLQKAVNR